MRLRAVHLACLLLLLSSLSAAEGAVLHGRDPGRGRSVVGMLQQSAAAIAAATPLSRSLNVPSAAVSFASQAPLRTAWTMRPPAAHTASVHAVTAFGI